MRILLAYEHYPCSIGRFWKRGFQALGVEVASMGNCTGGRISWGPYDLSHWTDTPDYPLPNFQNLYDLDPAMMNTINGYDLFVNVDAAHWFRGRTHVPKVIIGTDPHCLNYDGQRRDCDLFVCMQDYYRRPTDLWIPYAYDEEWHHHADVPIDHDVTFWGVVYGNRAADFATLRQAGYNVHVGTGRVFSECVEDYCGGPVAYCSPSLQDLPARFFEAMAYGCVPVLTPCPDLALLPFKQGWHYETYAPGGLVAAVKRVLDDPDREQRQEDVRKAVAVHTWRNRANMLLQALAARRIVEWQG